MSKEKSTAVVETPEHGNLPAVYADFEQQAGSGFENADKDTYAIPFLTILQSGSPQCKKSDGAYIKGAEEGMLFNTVSGEVVDTENSELLIAPFYFEHKYNEFGLREEGGGFFGSHLPGAHVVRQTSRDEKGRDILPNGHQLTDCREHYVLVIKADGSYYPAVMSLSSTQISKSKKWMSFMNGLKMRGKNGLFTPPMAAHVFKLRTVPESNEKGSWFGWAISPVKDDSSPTGFKITGGEIYNAAMSLLKSIKAGEVKVQDPGAADAAGASGDNQEDPPF